jgi:hypothetical protein
VALPAFAGSVTGWRFHRQIALWDRGTIRWCSSTVETGEAGGGDIKQSENGYRMRGMPKRSVGLPEIGESRQFLSALLGMSC